MENIVEEVRQEISDKEQEEIKSKVKAFVKSKLERAKIVQDKLAKIEEELAKVEEGDFEEALKYGTITRYGSIVYNMGNGLSSTGSGWTTGNVLNSGITFNSGITSNTMGTIAVRS